MNTGSEDPARLEALLRAWADINSGSHHRAGLQRMHDALAAELGGIPGVEVESLPLPDTAPALRARLRPDAPRRILFCGHFDTVYGPDHPFQTCSPGPHPDSLRGPGVIDMKGGLVILAAALRSAVADPECAHIGIEVLLVPDEEIGSPASGTHIAEAAARVDAALVFEPQLPDGSCVRNRMGTGLWRAHLRGRAAHSGRDFTKGRNAVVAAAGFVMGADSINRDITGAIVNVARIEGGGAANIVPDTAWVELGVRAATAAAQKEVAGRLQALASAVPAQEGFACTLEGGFNRPPREANQRDARLFNLYQNACVKVGGAAPQWRDVGGASDGNILAAAGAPVLDGIGARGDGMHSPDEWIHLPSLLLQAQRTLQLLRTLAHQRRPAPSAAPAAAATATPA